MKHTTIVVEHPFEKALSVSFEDIEFELRGFQSTPWANFLLNPRRLRGSDFLMRWSQGVWSEKRVIQLVNETQKYFAIPYGPSGTAPNEDVRAFELYFERLEKAGLGQLKRPDILIFKKSDYRLIEDILSGLGGINELPFIPEDNSGMVELLRKSTVAIECENSLWVAAKMPDYGTVLRPMKRLGGLDGLKKNAVVPTIIIKDEDLKPLKDWQRTTGKNIHIWHIFYDLAYGLPLNTAEELINKGLIEPTEQIFQAPGGATSKKVIYKFYYHYAYELGIAVERPQLIPAVIEDKNGHILPYVTFKGGKLKIRKEALKVLDRLSKD